MLLERLADGVEVGARTTEQMARDVGRIGVEKLLHPPDIIDPHDL